MKTIGDALMLRVPNPDEAVLLALDMTHGLMRGHGSPAVRVGLHHGPAIERDGDYFGATVNLAARVSGLASGGEVLVTGGTAALAPDLEGVFTSRAVARRCGAFANWSRSSPRSTRAAPRRAGWWLTPCAEWPSTRSARRAGSSTKARRTTSARSPAQASSRAPERFVA